MVAGVVLESVRCVVALSALSTPGAAGAAHTAGTPNAVSVSSCKQNKNKFMVSMEGEKRPLITRVHIKKQNQRQTFGSSRCFLSSHSRPRERGQKACRGWGVTMGVMTGRMHVFGMKAVLWQSRGARLQPAASGFKK